MSTQSEKFQLIANAIRNKTHRTSGIIANNFETEINSIVCNDKLISLPFGKGYSNFDNAYEAVKIAMSYWNAKASGTETFQYSGGNGCLKGSTSAQLHNSSGQGIIDCSTYIGLIMRGIGYLDSPYYNSSSTTCDPRNVICKNVSWAEQYYDLQANRYTGATVFPNFDYKTNDGKYRVLTASDMGQYYDKMGLLWFSDTESAQVGDLCFFYKENSDGTLKYPTRFAGLSHVGIMTDSEHYLNATDYDSAGDLIRTSVSTRPPYMYARPIYGAFTDGITTTLTNNKVDLIPNVWAGVKQGSTTGNNSCSLVLSAKKLTATGTGTGSSHMIISKSCPLTLPSGTYKLTGVVNNTGANTTTNHSYFGTRVYNANTGSGITGNTTTSNGATVKSRTPVWDIGGGATFTLAEETPIYIDAYLSSNKTFSGLTIEPVLYKTA